MAVVNFPKKQIGPLMSECLVTGLADANGGTGIYLDVFSHAAHTPCCDLTHSHPPGGGNWEATARQNLVNQMNVVESGVGVVVQTGPFVLGTSYQFATTVKQSTSKFVYFTP